MWKYWHCLHQLWQDIPPPEGLELLQRDQQEVASDACNSFLWQDVFFFFILYVCLCVGCWWLMTSEKDLRSASSKEKSNADMVVMRMTWSNMRMILRTCNSQAREKKGCASHEDWEGPESPDVEGRRAGKIWFLKLVKYICGNKKHRHSHSYNVQ